MSQNSYDPNYYREHRDDNEINPNGRENLSTACLVLGVIAIIMAVSCCLSWLSIVPAIASIICGILARDERGNRSGNTMAGLFFSGISIAVFLLVILCGILLYNNGKVHFYQDGNAPFEFQLPGSEDNDNDDGNFNPGNNDNETENGPL